MVRLRLVRERAAKPYPTLRQVRDARDVYLAFRSEAEEADRESFHVVVLDGKNRVLGFNLVSIGSLTAALVHPREVFKPAVLANAAALILVHNHPSGNPEPSAEDRAITQRLRQAGELLGIRVLDHVIIGDDDFVSLAERAGW
jgi:DNA repair protein RadC